MVRDALDSVDVKFLLAQLKADRKAGFGEWRTLVEVLIWLVECEMDRKANE